MLLDEDEINLATYNLYSTINSAIDNYEKRVIEDEDGYAGTETRTTPVNLNTEQDDYYPSKTEGGKTVLDYGVYTGYGKYSLANSGAYNDDALDGTTRSTRKKAYNSFLNNLRRNNLVDGDAEAEKLTDVLELKYIKSEKVSQLKSQIINKYYDLYEEQKEELLKGAYIEDVYNEVLAAQAANFDKSSAAFDSAMSSMSSSSFILYSPDTTDSDWYIDYGEDYAKYGFIYNILLPFDANQSKALNNLKKVQDAKGDDYYYAERNKILQQIETVDQRSAWFNGATDYSFKPDADFGDYYGKTAGREYLFFEDNLTNSGEGKRYKELQAYVGKYAYNGKVIENQDESYTLIPNSLNIDDMLAEFKAYVEYVLGSDCVDVSTNENYYNTEKFTKDDDEDEIDYSLFTYATGKVKFDEAYNSANLMNPDSPYYKAMSAVNELQYAYTTDTGVLSNYVGYSLTAYDTSYIKEFEWASKEAVGRGVGAFAVCAGDYGWHLIYVTHVFDAEEVYKDHDWSRIEEEGTFENLFYEWVKNNDLKDISTTRRTQILNDFNKDTTVTKYQKRYQDLLDLDNN